MKVPSYGEVEIAFDNKIQRLYSELLNEFLDNPTGDASPYDQSRIEAEQARLAVAVSSWIVGRAQDENNREADLKLIRKYNDDTPEMW